VKPAAPAKPAAHAPGAAPAGARPGAVPGKPNAAQPAGKVVHDKRGTAMWDWLAQTGRMAIESTTRLLKKLEAPELKMEQTHEEELRIAPDDTKFEPGGGYDPYNQATKPRK
jgi:hypothetical protein